MPRHQTSEHVLPIIESGRTYSPEVLAEEIVNLHVTPEGTLRAVRGPCPYIPNYGSGYPSQYGRMHGVYHASLDGGARDCLLISTGSTLCVARGYLRNLETLKSGLSNEAHPRFPDQFCEVGGRVIWTNGVDRALCYDGHKIYPLGYDVAPSSPTPMGPQPAETGLSSTGDNPSVYRNSVGYSHPGRIGTPGDYLAGQDGHMRAGSWYYWVQWEDVFGNLSPLSPMSCAVTVRTEEAATSFLKSFLSWDDIKQSLGVWAVQIDDLTRQFFVGAIPVGPEGTVARLVYRTRDTQVNAAEPCFLVRIPDNATTVYPDNHADSELGPPAGRPLAAVPTFKVMCPYAGGLAIANTTASPGLLRLSDPGFPGTFREHRKLYPDSAGAEITGLASFEGKLLAFTLGGCFEIVDQGPDAPLLSVPLPEGRGCVGPSTIKPTGFGALVWKGGDGRFYGLKRGATESVSDAIAPLLATLNGIRASLAAAEWCPEYGVYLCAVARSGRLGNDLLLAFDGNGWTRQAHDFKYSGLTLTKDSRQMVIGCGDEGATAAVGTGLVVALDRETRSYTRDKLYRYRTNWLRPDPTGRRRFSISAIYVGLIESTSNKLAWRVWKNGRRDVVAVESVAVSEMTMLAPDLVDLLTTPGATMSTLVVGSGKLRKPRLFWKQFDIKLTDVDSFSFELYGTSGDGEFPHIGAFAFDRVEVDEKGARVTRG